MEPSSVRPRFILVLVLSFDALLFSADTQAEQQRAQTEQTVFHGQVVSITETPLLELAPYDVATLTGQKAVPFSPDLPINVVPRQAKELPVPNRPLPIEPAQATATPTPPGATLLLDTFNGRTVSFTGSVPHTYMGDGFLNNTIGGSTTYVSLRSYAIYMMATVVANYSDIHARLTLWNSFDGANASVFADSAAFFDVDLGPLNVTTAPTVFTINVTVSPPYPFFVGGPGTAWGYSQNFQSSISGGAVADDTNLTSTVTSGAPYGAGVIAPASPTIVAPNFGYYRNASSEVNFNFLSSSARMLSGLTSQGVGIIIRGDLGTGPTPTPASTATPGTPSPTPTPTATPSPTITPPPPACGLFETMQDITTLPAPKGWVEVNNSSPPLGTGWFQGVTGSFTAHSSPPNSYIAANYQNTGGTTGTETLSNWLITPPVTIVSGSQVVFWTRTLDVPSYPDRLQVRLSTNGNSANVGNTPTSVGDFTTLLLDINPTYQTTGSGSYPNTWTQFFVTITGYIFPTTGRIAFRYFVENGGPAGVNSDYIGIDSVSYDCPDHTPTPAPSPAPTPTATPIGCQILYDQANNLGGSAIESQDYPPSSDARDDQAADDFVVPVGETWNVQQLFAQGPYSGPGTVANVNLYFYSDSAGFPGVSVGTYLSAPVTTYQTNSLTITVPGGGLILGPGTYWVSVQAIRGPLNTTWGWTNRAVTSNNPAVWQNPGGGSGGGVCTTWGRRGAICGLNSESPDQVFLLYGCQITPTPTPSPTPTQTPVASPSPTESPQISGTVFFCANPTPLPLPMARLSLTGSATSTTASDSLGHYQFVASPGGSYTVTPTKSPLSPASAGINTTDVLATQRHFLGITLLSGCRLTAADTNGDTNVTTVDVIAIQRFFLGFVTGTANVGKYQFNPSSRSYNPLFGTQVSQNYDGLVLGDVASPFVAP